MEKVIQIEFFHDIICSFCFPMSYRMRQIEKKYPQVEIIHRSFALAPDSKALEYMFGSREQAKVEVLGHWVHANQNDDLHRFNIEGMAKADFAFPTSMPALIATKAAYRIGGDSAYWLLFDALQDAFFVKNKNVENLDVIKAVISETMLDMTEWEKYFQDPETLKLVEADFALAQAYHIQSVPSLVIEKQYLLNGALPLEQIEQSIQQVLSLHELQQVNADAGTCSIVDGKMNCE